MSSSECSPLNKPSHPSEHHREDYHLEGHPEDWLILDYLINTRGAVKHPMTTFKNEIWDVQVALHAYKCYKDKTSFVAMQRTPWWKVTDTTVGALIILNFGVIKSYLDKKSLL